MERTVPARWVLCRAWLGVGVAAAVGGCNKPHTACDDCGTGGKLAAKVHHDTLHGKFKANHPNCDVDNCSDIPQGALPAPPGTYVTEFFARQQTKAEADDFVFYYNEFLDGTTNLGPYGSDHLARTIRRIEQGPHNILIQPDRFHPPAVTLARKKLIVDELAKAGVQNPAERVQIGLALPEGLFGEEAERIYQQVLQDRGAGGFGGGSFGGFGGFNGGFGGGGGFR